MMSALPAPTDLPSVDKARLPATYEGLARFAQHFVDDRPQRFLRPQDAVAAYATLAVDIAQLRAPHWPGVYGFWSGDTCMYIGESRCLARRLYCKHERRRELLLRRCAVRWLVCANHKSVERWLIKALSPLRNGRTEAQENIERRRAIMSRLPPPELLAELWSELFGWCAWATPTSWTASTAHSTRQTDMAPTPIDPDPEQTEAA